MSYHPRDLRENFRVIHEEEIPVFLDTIAECYGTYVRLCEKHVDETIIPSPAGIWWNHNQWFGDESFLYQALEDSVCEHLSYEQPDVFPHPFSDYWTDEHTILASDFIGAHWAQLEGGMVHDIEVAFKLLNLSYVDNRSSKLHNNPITEVW